MTTIPTTRPGRLRRAWLTVRLWVLLYKLDSAERYLHECELSGIAQGRNLSKYHEHIDSMVELARKIDKELQR